MSSLLKMKKEVNVVIWNNKGKQFDKFAKDWILYKEYILWGAGSLGEKFYIKFSDKVNIKYWIDSDKSKWGTQFHEHNVYKPVLENILNKGKIIITSRFYEEIKRFLLDCGLEEYIHFCDEQFFEAIYMFYVENKIYFREVDLAITEHCTLNCINCNMRIGEYLEPKHLCKKEVADMLDDYFKWVDYVEYLALLGGEPFLHPQLEEIIEYAAQNYRHRIGTLAILTNGTIIPSKNIIKKCIECDVSIQLSDYSAFVKEISNQVYEFKNIIQENNLNLDTIEYDYWLDFISTQKDENEDEIIKKFERCKHPWRSVYQKKYYLCHLQTSAFRANETIVNSDDVFDLEEYDYSKRKLLLEYNQKCCNKGYLSYCKKCNGNIDIYDNRIVPALQKR